MTGQCIFFFFSHIHKLNTDTGSSTYPMTRIKVVLQVARISQFYILTTILHQYSVETNLHETKNKHHNKTTGSVILKKVFHFIINLIYLIVQTSD